MQTLAHALHDQDLGQLRIIADLWGFDLPTGSTAEAASDLAGSMLDRALLAEIIDALPPAAHEAIWALLRNQGRLPMTDLSRKFGPLRQMGPGRRDREQPWRKGASPIESLWYRGLIARAFFDTPTGPQEFGYIPPDLADLLPTPEAAKGVLDLDPIAQPEDVRHASDLAVDDVVTILAALRRRPAASKGLTSDRLQALHPFLHQPQSALLLIACLLEDRVLVGGRLAPDPEAVRSLLDSSRSEILTRVRTAWQSAEGWNDLAQIPHLRPGSGAWPNDPLVSRQAVLNLLAGLKSGQWWNLSQFIQAVHESSPGFQRPAGDFDSWYLQDARTGSFLRGLAHWDLVEGALIHSMITGPLYWLGMLDLGLAAPGGPAVAFRLTPGFVLGSEFEAHTLTERGEGATSAQVRPDGLISVSRLSAPSLRYQIARICAWESRDTKAYHYRLTPGGLALAAAQGLEPSHVRTILEGASQSPLPKQVIESIGRWAELGTRARLERMLVFSVEDPELLGKLRANRATARYLRQSLGPTSASVAERDWPRLCEAATRMGILIEPPDGGGSP